MQQTKYNHPVGAHRVRPPSNFDLLAYLKIFIISEFALINAFPCVGVPRNEYASFWGSRKGRWMRATRINTYNLNVGEQTDE